MAEPQGPVRPRQQLGTELRRLRLLARLTQPEMARRLGLSQAKVSRLETGSYRPAIDVVRAWLEVTDVAAELRERLLALTEAAQTDTTGWREIFRGSMAAGQHKLLSQDAAAQKIRHFQPFQVPGPFHTAEYARIALLAFRLAGEADIDDAVELRLERGRRLRRPEGPEYHAIVTEMALRFMPKGAGPGARPGVWRELIASREIPRVTVQVIPADTPMSQAPMCAFIISDFRPDTGEPTVVDVELPAMEITTSRPEDVATYEVAWRRLEEAALDPNDSLAFIAKMLADK